MLILKEITRKVVFLYNLQEVFQITVQNQKQEKIHLFEKRVELYPAYLYLFFFFLIIFCTLIAKMLKHLLNGMDHKKVKITIQK